MVDKVVGNDMVVQLHYEIRDETGEMLATSREGEPVAALQGHGNLMPGLEQALDGRTVGDSFDVQLAPQDAYGAYIDGLVQRYSKKQFAKPARLKVGMRTLLKTPQGPRQVTVVKVGGKMVDVDMNHPFAGRTLNISVELLDLREASAEEIAHGHVHGPGGHAH